MSVVRGHGLRADGAPLDANGRHAQVVGYGEISRSGPGHAACACGTISPTPLPSLRARRAWHNDHKTEILERTTP